MYFYHIGFSDTDLGDDIPVACILSGDPERSKLIALNYLKDARCLSNERGLSSYLGKHPDSGQPILCSTSGMGGPSLSIVVNELVQAGLKRFIRVGTCGSIQDYVEVGSVVISSSALCRQGAAQDIAPIEFPAAADPFLTVSMAGAAEKLGVDFRVGITASVDTFYEGQERTATSANPNLQLALQGKTEEYKNLGILNYEMESGTLFKMAGVYGFSAACVCGVVAKRTENETVRAAEKQKAVDAAIRVAVATAILT